MCLNSMHEEEQRKVFRLELLDLRTGEVEAVFSLLEQGYALALLLWCLQGDAPDLRLQRAVRSIHNTEDWHEL